MGLEHSASSAGGSMGGKIWPWLLHDREQQANVLAADLGRASLSSIYSLHSLNSSVSGEMLINPPPPLSLFRKGGILFACQEPAEIMDQLYTARATDSNGSLTPNQDVRGMIA